MYYEHDMAYFKQAFKMPIIFYFYFGAGARNTIFIVV